jgi:hypothetical protein
MSDLSVRHLQPGSKGYVLPAASLVISFAWMMLSNSLANSLPLNGYSTGAVSALYPNRFVPAGFTFSIWGVIYILLTGWLVMALMVLKRNHHEEFIWRHVRSTRPLFVWSCVLNGAWIFAWHYLQLFLSVLIMLLLLLVLIRMYSKMQTYQSALTGFSRIWLYQSMIVYMAWISVATIANITALLVGWQWTPQSTEESYWSIGMISVAFLLGILIGYKRKEPAFLIVLAWAFYGIGKGQEAQSMVVRNSALIAATLSVIFTIGAWLKKSRSEVIDGVL